MTTYRDEVYRSDSRKPEVTYGDTLEGDLLRRDLTVNAMAVTLPDKAFVDPFGGLRDLAAGVLRTPGRPQDSFDDDPLRMMRVARFAAQLGFTVDPAVVAAMTEMADRIAIVSAERVRDELVKLVCAPRPRAGLALLVETGLAAPRRDGHDDNSLVAIGHVAEHELQVWCGSAQQLNRVTEFAAPVPAGGLVSLIKFRNEWHLFARSEHGRSSHLVSTDLCEWSHLTQLVSSFPAFAVSGVAVRDDELLLAGRVFVDDTAFGWGLLRSDGRNFEARPVPLPLATQLGVVGPVVNHEGNTLLLLDSGRNRTIATSAGQGWTLGMLVPDVSPAAVFAHGADLWTVGHHNLTGVASLAKVTDERVIALPAADHAGRVRVGPGPRRSPGRRPRELRVSRVPRTSPRSRRRSGR